MKKTISKKSVKVAPVKKNAAGLYQSTTGPTGRAKNFRPVYYTVQDTPKANTSYDRLEQIRMARTLYTSCPDLGGALNQKSQWVCGPGAFKPIYQGENTTWGDKAEEWLVDTFFPYCSLAGQNQNFQTLLNLSSLALDIDGDTGMVLTSTTTGFPKVGLIAGHRIGQRTVKNIVEKGKFKDYTIIDGVITNDNGTTIGYRILGDKQDGSQDYDVAINDMQLLYEPEFADQQRGISKIARSITDWADQSDINDFLLRSVKLASSIGLKHKTEDGTGNGSAFDPGATEDTASPDISGVTVTNINGGDIYFLKPAAGEDIETLKNENPSQNTEAFINRIQKRALYSIGWPQEMLDASKVGGASVRLIQDLVRKTISSRQETIERRAKLIVTYAIAKAIKNGYLPKNDEWYKWSFTKGAVLTVDSGNEQKAAIENYKLGITTLSEICAKNGQDWYEVRNQSQRETQDLIDRAMALSKANGLSFETCLTLLQQQTPNQAPVSMPPTVEPDTTE